MAELLANGVRLHVQRLGPAGSPTVVFLHGLVMDNMSSWYFSVAPAVAAKHSVLLYDLRGHGKSERPPTGYSLREMVDDLTALLDAAGADRVALAGNSFGGLLAAAFALAQPARVTGLFLLDAHPADARFGAEMAFTMRLRGKARDARVAAIKTWLGRHSERRRFRMAAAAEALVDGTTLIEDMARTPALDLRGLEVPILALYGERSDLRARAEAVLAGLPRARVEILPGCGHSLLWEATDEVRRRALAFLAEPGP